MRYVPIVAAIALLAAGCGGKSGTTASSSDGAKVFESAGCGGCHTLAAAKSNGQTGPNLDALKPSEENVKRQVENGGGGMPSFHGRLSAKQIAQVASYVSSSANASSGASATAFHPNGEKLSECHGDYACYKQAFGNVAYYDSPATALARLATYMRTNATVRSGCHQIAHSIGHAGFAKYHNAAQALANGSMTCWSGYYHGVVERAFAGVPRSQVKTLAAKMCEGASIRKTYFLAYQCVHGLGHGLMIYSLNDLPYSLKVCDSLPTQWDQSSCTGGVFMQNFLPGPMQIAPTKWLKRSDLLYPCDTVGSRDKLYCYLMVTSRILPVVHYDFRKAASWCWKAEKAWIATCFQSFGRDASGNSVQNPRKIVETCHLAGSMERECIYGGSRDLTSNDAGPKRATQMCNLAPAKTRSYCFYGIGTILGGFANDAAGRRARCAPVPAAYRADCYRGARA